LQKTDSITNLADLALTIQSGWIAVAPTVFDQAATCPDTQAHTACNFED